LRFLRFLADDPDVHIDKAVAASEQRTGFRNIALANYMKSFGVLDNPVEHALGVYFHHCAIAMSCRQLAMAGRFLAYDGRNPSTGMSVVPPGRARRINAVMLTCGHYDGSGEFAYRVGLPGKSGVGGGILAIAPGKASIAAWSPGLDASGNSHLGRIGLEMLTKRMGWSIFGCHPRESGDPGAAARRVPTGSNGTSCSPWIPAFAGMTRNLAVSVGVPVMPATAAARRPEEEIKRRGARSAIR
jgi:glutaminase